MSWQVIFTTSGGEVTVKSSDTVELCEVTISEYTRQMSVMIDYSELNEFYDGLGQVMKMMKSQRKVKKDARVVEEPEAG